MSVYRRPFDYRTARSNLFMLLAAASATSGTTGSTFDATGTLTGVGALAGTSTLTLSASATSSSDAPIQGSSALVTTANASLLGSGALAGVSALILDGAATGTVSQTFNTAVWPKKIRWARFPVDYNYYSNRLTFFPYNVSADVTGQSDIVFGGTGLLTGIGRLIGAGGMLLSGAGVLRGTGALVSSTPITITGSGTLSGTISGVVTGTSDLTLTPLGVLTGIGVLTGTSGIQFTAGAFPSQFLEIAGLASLVFDAIGALTDAAVPTVGEPRLRFAAKRERTVFRAR